MPQSSKRRACLHGPHIHAPPSTLACNPPLPRYALGVFTRRGSSSGASTSGRLEVMPAEGGKILRMEPRVSGVLCAGSFCCLRGQRASKFFCLRGQ